MPRPKPPAGGMPCSSASRKSSSSLLRFFAGLFEQALPLRHRIVQLGVTGRNFLAVDDELVNVD